MRNPLRKRVAREIGREWKKYLVLFLLMTIVIGFVSGMFVANDSMEAAATEAYEKYCIEDGHFELKYEATPELISAFEREDVRIYRQYYRTLDEDINGDGARDAGIRVFVMRDEVNRASLIEGAFPTEANEIVIDRMHADNRGVTVGDTIELGGVSVRVSGLAAFSDYSTLFENNGDIMFDALTFNVGAMTREGYDKLGGQETYQYAFRYAQRPQSVGEQKEMADRLVKQLAVLCLTGGMTDDSDEAERIISGGDIEKLGELMKLRENANELTDFVPEYANNAIHFAPDDMGSDKSMGEVLLIVFVVVLAFIFAITASNTITSEAAVIGTLRASGFTRLELVLHYVTVPVLVTLLSAVAGNVLGYTVFKNTVVSMYYNSYSLPAYETLWNADAFVKTTVYPMIAMIAVNVLVVYRKLKISPLRFLRGDITGARRKKAVRLPKWGFLSRYRIRVLIKNATGYLTLALGIFFVMVLMAFSVGMPATLDNYRGMVAEYVVADYQYVLKETVDQNGNAVTTSEPTAEKYSVYGLKTVDGVHVGESVTVYGYSAGSRYFELPAKLSEGEAYVSEAYAEKFGLSTGGTITLKESYTDKTFEFKIAGTYALPGTIAVFMPNDSFNSTFGLEAGSFSGYLSEKEIKDIDGEMIYSVITVDDALKMANQLDHSMGGYMTYFSVACMLAAMLIIYLLTKLIIESNAVSISMVKVLGYTDREINRLYIRSTTAVVVISTFITSLLGALAVRELWKTIMYDMNGWFTFYLGAKEIIEIVAMVLIAYAAVALFDMRRIRRIPLTEALKNAE